MTAISQASAKPGMQLIREHLYLKIGVKSDDTGCSHCREFKCLGLAFLPSFLFHHTSLSVCLLLSVSLSLEPMAYKREISTLKRKHGMKG